MSKRVRLFILFGLIAGILVSAAPRMADAAGGPLLKTGTYKAYAKCDYSGDEHVCQIHDDQSYYLLYTEGSHFTPHGKVRVRITKISTGQVLSNATITAKG